WGPRQWRRRAAGWKYEGCVAFFCSDDDNGLVQKGAYVQSASEPRLSYGGTLLNRLAAMSPAEIYLAGIDLGVSGRIDQAHPNACEPSPYRERCKSRVSSRRQIQPLDELLVREI